MTDLPGRLSPRARAREIFTRLAAANPTPTTELAYGNVYQLLIAVMLSAQSTDVGVNRATRTLFQSVYTPAQMVALGETGLREHIRTIGLFNSKAKNVIRASQMLIEQHGGEVPKTRVDLEALPGVGRKTANVVLNTAFGEPTLAVDTHLFRLGNRLGIARGKTPLEVERKFLKVIPEAFLKDAHHWLILHGRYCCTARAPNCAGCTIAAFCSWRGKAARMAAAQVSPV